MSIVYHKYRIPQITYATNTVCHEYRMVTNTGNCIFFFQVNKQRERIVVLTPGANPTILALGGKVIEYPVTPLTKEEMVDTNGAGDAFCGGEKNF